MNELKNKKLRDFEKPFPGCMGRMINLFDLGPGMAGNRLLTERSYRDGFSLPRGQPHMTKKALDPNGDRIEDKPVAYELKSYPNKKSNGTPMKMLIAQEMSKETKSKNQPPSVVARLMGLDGLPAQHSASTARSLPQGYLRAASIDHGTTPKYLQQENGHLDKQMPGNYSSRAYAQEQPEYKDVYEVWQKSYVKDQPRQNGRCNENSSEKKMALVRQKFIEAKRLATDEKLRQSKEFQDALEVLSSNRDLFLKFLQEPNSLFSKHLHDLESIPPPPQTKSITVLKPSKTVETNACVGPDIKTGKQIKKQQQLIDANEWGRDKPSWTTSFAHQRADNCQPTRIVVLKPSPGKSQDIKGVASSPNSSSRLLYDKDFYRDAETDEARGSREIAKEITRQMRENFSSSRRDEVMPSSVLSNGYVGDESSFNRSENEYIEEGNLSDSEIMTPTSRHSWDYVNRYSSPYSSSSFSRASNSPESSVTREAKKRLSERLAMMSSTGSIQEQRQVRRSSSTLGEMLALPDKKNVRSTEDGNGPSFSSSRSCDGRQELQDPLASLSSSGNRDERMEDSPRNLSRSRSVPVSSTAYGKVELNNEVPGAKISKSVVQKEVPKPKSGKSSFKGKVSSLFFSKNKKMSKDKLAPFHTVGVQPAFAGTLEILPDIKQPSVGQKTDLPECAPNDCLGEGHPLNLERSSCKTSSSTSVVGPKLHTSSSEAVLSLAKPGGRGNSSENQDQPSPVSILEAPFEDDANTAQSSETVHEEDNPEPSARLHHKSGLSAKSPLISVSRSLLWDDDVSEPAQTYPWKLSSPLKPSAVSSNTEEQERERSLFVRSLLSVAGLHHEKPEVVISRWHSPESPLDPLLLDKCIDQKEDGEEQNEARRRQRRSERKLLFDCVNVVLAEMVGFGSDEIKLSATVSCKRDLPVGTVEVVLGRVKEWVSAEAKWVSEENDTSMVVEGIVRKEVVERGWGELMRPEIDGLGKEIEGKLLEELVEELMSELTCL